jgi:hypothetical protein
LYGLKAKYDQPGFPLQFLSPCGACGISAAIQAAWAADRSVSPTRGFAHDLLVRPFKKIATSPWHPTGYLRFARQRRFANFCNTPTLRRVNFVFPDCWRPEKDTAGFIRCGTCRTLVFCPRMEDHPEEAVM